MRRLLSGNEAVARGAFEAGCRKGFGYPGTPSTEILEDFSRRKGCSSQWSLNEKIALESAVGMSLSGRRCICTMKHVGVNVASDMLFTLAYSGCNAGLVIVVCDDPGMHSSQNEQDSRHYAKAAKLPCLEPSDSQEALEYSRLAFDLSEKHKIPFIIRLTMRISHTRTPVTEGAVSDPGSLDYVKETRRILIPFHARNRPEEINHELHAIETDPRFLTLNKASRIGDVGVISSGMAYNYAKEVFTSASFLKLSTIYPFPRKQVYDFCKIHEKIFVVEELSPFIEEHVRSLGFRPVGKKMFPNHGELSPVLIRDCLDGRKRGPAAQAPRRLPSFCKGCSYNITFKCLKEHDIMVSGDIGCYALASIPPVNTLDSIFCMGASIGVGHGFSCSGRKAVAVIGDSTFFHSGLSSIANAKYHGSNLLVLILDNSVTAMTGGQEHPGTKQDIEISKLTEAMGIETRVMTHPREGELRQALEDHIKKDGLSVLILKAPCIQHLRKR